MLKFRSFFNVLFPSSLLHLISRCFCISHSLIMYMFSAGCEFPLKSGIVRGCLSLCSGQCSVHPQVTEEWSGQKVSATGVLDDCSLVAFRERVQSALHDTGPIRKAAAPLRHKYQANTRQVQALDNALQQGAGISIATFVPAVHVGALKAGERRYFVDASTAPAHLTNENDDRTRRSCIIDTTSKATRLEVPWHSNRPALFSVVDQGAVGWPSKHWLYMKLQLRGGYSFDPPHRRSNNIMNAYKQVGVWAVQLEYSVVFNFLQGPWKRHANFQICRQAAMEYFSNFDHEDELFRLIYDWIALDTNAGRPPRGMGSEDHMKQTLQSLSENCIFQTQGHTVKTNRWFAWQKRFKAMESNLSVLLLVLLYMGLHKNRFARISDIPYFGGVYAGIFKAAEKAPEAAPSPLEDAGAASSSDRPPERMSVKASTAEVERLRDASSNTAHMVTCILANRSNRRVAMVMCHITFPVEEAHILQVTQCKTQAGTMHWYACQAAREYDEYLARTWGVLHDEAFLTAVGFGAREGTLSDTTFDEDDMIAETAVDLARNIVGNEIITMSSYSHRPFCKFAAALHLDAQVRSDLLAWCARAFSALEKAEAKAVEEDKADTWKLKEYIGDMLWPLSVWDREVLVAGAETDWQHWPMDVLSEFQAVFRGFVSTKPVEDTFGIYSDEARQSKSGRLGRCARWHRAMASPLLEEVDRKGPPIDGKAKYAAGGGIVPNTIFEAKVAKPSMGQEVLDTLGGKVDITPDTGKKPLPETRCWLSFCFACEVGHALLSTCHCMGWQSAPS